MHARQSYTGDVTAQQRNAHLATLFSRLLKLLYYGVRPVFVFDGPNVPFKRRELVLQRKVFASFCSCNVVGD